MTFEMKTAMSHPHADWFPDEGETQQLAVSGVFSRWFQHWSNGHAEAFNDLGGSLLSGHLLGSISPPGLGPTAGQAVPQWGPFHQLCIYSSLWLTPSACTGSLFSLPALLRGLCGRESRNPSGLRVCTCFALLCSSSRWGGFAEGTKWSQASCSNRLKGHVLFCVWG